MSKADQIIGEAHGTVSLMKKQKNAMMVAAILLFMFIMGVVSDSAIFRDVAIMGTLILQGMRSV
jgi:hypothetical protein